MCIVFNTYFEQNFYLSMREYENRVKFTAIVVTCNEGPRLRACLDSLSFCDQLIVIDLGSMDGSVDIAKEFGAEIIHHRKVPIVEEIRAESIHWARNDWIVFLDPDEVLPDNVESNFRSIIKENPKVGRIGVPWRFYFKGRPLTSTLWGKAKIKPVAFHRKRNQFFPYVHRGSKLLSGYHMATIQTIEGKDRFIRHYWVDSYGVLLKKHLRYVSREGEARYRNGERFSWHRLIIEPLSALKYNLLEYKGIKDGFRGFFLSVFYSLYVAMSLVSLFWYERWVNAKRDQT